MRSCTHRKTGFHSIDAIARAVNMNASPLYSPTTATSIVILTSFKLPRCDLIWCVRIGRDCKVFLSLLWRRSICYDWIPNGWRAADDIPARVTADALWSELVFPICFVCDLPHSKGNVLWYIINILYLAQLASSEIHWSKSTEKLECRPLLLLHTYRISPKTPHLYHAHPMCGRSNSGTVIQSTSGVANRFDMFRVDATFAKNAASHTYYPRILRVQQ